jgi:S-adenosylmethionine:tRNA ribosyltransferase-isomerase
LVHQAPSSKREAVRTDEFDYDLPPDLIAQEPASARDQSRLMVVPRAEGSRLHHRFAELPGLLRRGDLLIVNDSKVIPARLRAANAKSGGQFEVLLLEENGPNDWWAMMRPAKRAPVGAEIILKLPSNEPSPIRARVIETHPTGHRRLEFLGTADLANELESLGEVPLPPYLERESPNRRPEDRERYQTVYAGASGSVAAPTAGLHFTPELLATLGSAGIEIGRVTLHVGPGTFAPVKCDRVEDHLMHEERFVIAPSAADQVNAARASGRRVVAVGTTAIRVLESAADEAGSVRPGAGRTRIFIHPPWRFRVVDALITNFHLPRSTLLMLVSAFAAPGSTDGCRVIREAYAEAVRLRYRFYSYGDAMLIQ